MKFQYIAKTKSGEMQTGYVEAVNKEGAFRILQGHDLFILSIEAPRAPGLLTPVLDYFKRVKSADLVIFTRQFATLLSAEISLGDALKNLYTQTKNPILREAIFEISADIDSGLSLSQALERHSNIFGEFYVNLIRSAEVTGRVEEVTLFLADYLEKENAIRTKVRNAMIYPAFVLGLFVIVGGILVAVVFPKIGPIFEESGVEMPLITRLLLSLGGFLADWWLAIIITAALLLVFVFDYIKSKEGRMLFDELSIQLPVFGQLFKKSYIARFSESISVLIKGGIPIAQAIEVSGHTIGSVNYRESLHAAAEAVRGGELLSRVLAKDDVKFPSMMAQMVAVGETTGKLDEMFSRISSFYAREVDDMVNNLVELIQPTLMLGVGVLTGLLFASILLPIYSLVSVI